MLAFHAPLSLVIAGRYLRGRHSALLQGTARAALVSILIGVAAMVVAMALMAGYTGDLQSKLIGGSAAIVAYPLGPPSDTEVDRERLGTIPGVVSVAKVAYGQGSLSKAGERRQADVTLRGVDPGASSLVSNPALLACKEGVPGAVLGVDLARRIDVREGDELSLVAVDLEGPRFRYIPLRFAGTFESGFAEADRTWAVVDRNVVERAGGRSVLLEIQLEDPTKTESAKIAATEILENRYMVTDWKEFNRELFSALGLQKLALFFVLGLIVVVSTFNVASSLVVLARERRREIGVLSAMGLKPAQVRNVFRFCGLFLGSAGTALGVALGWSVAWILTTFEIIRFSDPGVAAIYFISSVPFVVRWQDLAAIVAFSLGATYFACWLPARRATAIQAGVALRYE